MKRDCVKGIINARGITGFLILPNTAYPWYKHCTTTPCPSHLKEGLWTVPLRQGASKDRSITHWNECILFWTFSFFFSPCAIHLVERKLLSLKRSSAMFTPQHNPSEQTWRRTGKAVWGVGVSGRSSCWHGRGAPAAGTRSSWLSAVTELTADLPYAHKFCHRTQSTTNFFVISITSWRYTILWRQNVSYATSKKWI